MKRLVFSVIQCFIACFCLSATAQIFLDHDETTRQAFKIQAGDYQAAKYYCYYGHRNAYWNQEKIFDVIVVFYARDAERGFSCRAVISVQDSDHLEEGQLKRMEDILTEISGVTDVDDCREKREKLFDEYRYRYCPMVTFSKLVPEDVTRNRGMY